MSRMLVIRPDHQPRRRRLLACCNCCQRRRLSKWGSFLPLSPVVYSTVQVRSYSRSIGFPLRCDPPAPASFSRLLTEWQTSPLSLSLLGRLNSFEFHIWEWWWDMRRREGVFSRVNIFAPSRGMQISPAQCSGKKKTDVVSNALQ